MKRWLYLTLALVIAFATSIIFVSSEEMDLSSPLLDQYPILEPFALVEDSIYSFRSGELYRAPFGGTGSLYTGTLTSALNELNVATLADVQAAAMTIPDMVSALKQYFSSGGSFETYSGNLNLPQQLSAIRSVFGTYPLTYNRRTHGVEAGTTSVSISSLGQLLMTIGQDLQYDFVIAAGSNVLNSNGTIGPTTTTRNLSYLFDQGLMGLATRLSGTSGSAQFDTYRTGTASQQVSNLLSALSLLNTNNINLLTSTGSTILFPDGTVKSVSGLGNIATINDYGFQGLATILRGVSSNGSAISWMDYSDLSTSTSSYTNLFDLNAAGFEHLQNLLAQYMYSHGTDLDIKERENMQPQAEQFVEDFTSPNGKGTMSTNDMSDLANVSSSMGSSFKSDATVSDVFTQLGSGDNYSFFSNEVLSDLEGMVPSSYSRNYDGYIDFLAPHFDQFREVVGSPW